MRTDVFRWDEYNSEIYDDEDRKVAMVIRYSAVDPHDGDGPILAASRDLLYACELLEQAEDANANCSQCEGDGVPELCPTCFPLFDRARVVRREAIAKARVV